MNIAEHQRAADAPLRDLGGLLGEAARTVEALFLKARSRARSAGWKESDQHALHGLAWFATYAGLMTELAVYANRLEAEGHGSGSLSRPGHARDPPSDCGGSAWG